jgi:hypothetical protein
MKIGPKNAETEIHRKLIDSFYPTISWHLQPTYFEQAVCSHATMTPDLQAAF